MKARIPHLSKAFLFYLMLMFSCNERNTLEKNIVIIDAWSFGPGRIADEILIINSLNPKVIAIDFMFEGPFSDEGVKLANVLSRCNKVVLASKIADDFEGKDIEYKELIRPPEKLRENAQTGFVNVILEDDQLYTLKRFSTREKVEDKIENYFAVQTAILFDSVRANKFLVNNPKVFDVNFLGNTEKFRIFTGHDVLEGKLKAEDIDGKIVLIGSFSPADNDRFYTSLSKERGFKHRDMFGVVYLANVVAQILADPNTDDN